MRLSYTVEIFRRAWNLDLGSRLFQIDWELQI